MADEVATDGGGDAPIEFPKIPDSLFSTDETPPAEKAPTDREGAPPKEAKAAVDTAPVDQEVTLPDGSKRKWSEIQERLSKADDYTQKTQSVAADRKAIADQQAALAREKELLQAGIRDLAENPEKYEALRKSMGVATREAAGPDPLATPDRWAQKRYDAYLAAGWKPEMKSREEWQTALRSDLLTAQNSAMLERLSGLEKGQASRELEAVTRAEADSVDAELESYFKDERYPLAATPEGRELVDAFIAQHVQRGDDVELETIVEKVQNFAARAAAGYVKGKQADATATQSHMRGGGGHRAETPKTYEPGAKGFSDITKDLMRGG